jgi:hypothetical protein
MGPNIQYACPQNPDKEGSGRQDKHSQKSVLSYLNPQWTPGFVFGDVIHNFGFPYLRPIVIGRIAPRPLGKRILQILALTNCNVCYYGHFPIVFIARYRIVSLHIRS